MTDPIEILRELLEAFTAKYPPAEAGQEAQTAWAMRQSTAEKAARSLLASPPAPAAQPAVPDAKAFRDLVNYGMTLVVDAESREVTAIWYSGIIEREPVPEGADKLAAARAAISRLVPRIEAALSVRPSNDIADDIPGSTAAGGGNTTAALTDDALLRFAIERYRGEFNEAVMIDFMRELLRHVSGVKGGGNA